MKKFAIWLAIFAALSYALSTPISKILLENIPEVLLASLLYFGAGIGIFIVDIISKIIKANKKKNKKEFKEEVSLERKDLKYVIGMIILDIIAPILLMFSLKYSNPKTVSLLNNFEIVATSLIALLIFKEKIGKNLWIGIIFVFIASIILSVDFNEGIQFSFGSLLTILACLVWGLENNCTRALSEKNPFQIVIIKGIFSGLGSLIVALILKESISEFKYVIYALLLGFVAYGLSVFFYVLAQRYLGAAKTSTYYAVSPFLGVGLCFILFNDIPSYPFFIALGIMIVGIFFVNKDNKENKDIKITNEI